MKPELLGAEGVVGLLEADASARPQFFVVAGPGDRYGCRWSHGFARSERAAAANGVRAHFAEEWGCDAAAIIVLPVADDQPQVDERARSALERSGGAMLGRMAAERARLEEELLGRMDLVGPVLLEEVVPLLLANKQCLVPHATRLDAGRLHDRDTGRLRETAYYLGVVVVEIKEESENGQHVDLVGEPYLAALEFLQRSG